MVVNVIKKPKSALYYTGADHLVCELKDNSVVHTNLVDALIDAQSKLATEPHRKRVMIVQVIAVLCLPETADLNKNYEYERPAMKISEEGRGVYASSLVAK